jgi:PAS domain S-box-containing protein
LYFKGGKCRVEKSDVAFWIWNNGQVLYVNSAYEEITQSPRSEFYKNPESALRLVHPDDIAHLLDSMTSYSYLEEGTLKEEFRIKQPDGNYRWVMARTFPMISDGNSKKILGIAEDISEIKEKEFAQEALSAKLTGILESTSDMVFAIDKSYKYTAFNQKYANYIQDNYGKTIEIGKNALDIFSSEEEVEQIKCDFDKALLKETVSAEYILFKQIPFADTSFHPIKNNVGEALGASVFIRNITEKKENEAKMKRNQQLLSSVNRNINEAIFRSTSSGGLVYINKGFIKMFGYANKYEVIALDPNELYANEAQRERSVNLILEKQVIENEEIIFKKKDGTEFVGLVNSILSTDDERNTYFDGAVRDITPIKAWQLELEQTNSKLTKMNQQLDRFVYTASHDLKAPLASISGLINIYKQEKDADLKEQYVNLMEKSVHKLEGFINEIVDYSRNDRTELKLQEFDFEEFTNEIFENLSFLNIGAHLKMSHTKKAYAGRG